VNVAVQIPTFFLLLRWTDILLWYRNDQLVRIVSRVGQQPQSFPDLLKVRKLRLDSSRHRLRHHHGSLWESICQRPCSARNGGTDFQFRSDNRW
jgi:hypothetical protein